jgi:hypothetical protein
MIVNVYVEGPSDSLALEALLAELLATKLQEGVCIRFIPVPPTGDRKTTLLTKMPLKALNILRNDPASKVALLPDLYPPNKGFDHKTERELQAGVKNIFSQAVASKGLGDVPGLADRFKVFCFKHEMEVLLLAAKPNLARYLACSGFSADWTEPVEDQNQDNPPSRVVERWFRQCGRTYDKTLDARAILQGVDYRAIARICPQCFKPFVEFLQSCGPA